MSSECVWRSGSHTRRPRHAPHQIGWHSANIRSSREHDTHHVGLGSVSSLAVCSERRKCTKWQGASSLVVRSTVQTQRPKLEPISQKGWVQDPVSLTIQSSPWQPDNAGRAQAQQGEHRPAIGDAAPSKCSEKPGWGRAEPKHPHNSSADRSLGPCPPQSSQHVPSSGQGQQGRSGAMGPSSEKVMSKGEYPGASAEACGPHEQFCGSGAQWFCQRHQQVHKPCAHQSGR